MGLFDQVIQAINNPAQQGSGDQVGEILSVVGNLANRQGIDPALTQTAISLVGNYVKGALQEKRATLGNESTEAIVNQYAGLAPNPEAVGALFSPTQQQDISNTVANSTGLKANTIQSLLPTLIPILLQLLGTGNSGTSGGNSVLNSFLDGDRDGDVDLGDALSMAGHFFGK